MKTKLLTSIPLVFIASILIWLYTRPQWEEVSVVPSGYHGQWVNVSYRDDHEGADTMTIEPRYFYFRQSNGWTRATNDPFIQLKNASASFRISTRAKSDKWEYLVIHEGTDLVRVYRIEEYPTRDGWEERLDDVGYFSRRR
jgi:hypothetical protein